MTRVIITFHGVGSPCRALYPGEAEYWFETEAFEAILDLVVRAPGTEITFDDGNISDAEIALPALLKRQLTATFFICSGRVDRPAFLSAAQLRSLRAAGMTIGSHGVEHVSWRHTQRTTLATELHWSRALLEYHTGAVVEHAACPFGAYDHVVLEEARAAGYRAVYTSDGGRCAEGSWLRPRTSMQPSSPLNGIAKLLFTGPSRTQHLLRRCRTLVKALR